MFISKHHYAVELAKLGNTVYFLNSPEKSKDFRPGETRIEKTDYNNLYVIKHRLFYPYILKHKAPTLHQFLLKYHIRNIFRRIGTTIHVVWSFDVSNTIPLKVFPSSCFKIFMPVDEPAMPEGAAGAKNADVLFSVTNEILDKYKNYHLPAMFVNHGVSELFINEHPDLQHEGKIQVGISGNFLRPDIDWHTLFKIINVNKDVIFNFYGAFDKSDSNLSDNRVVETNQQKKELQAFENVVLHGVVDSMTLAKSLKLMDCFLICYDISKDQSGGTNYHKVLEYMATGKVIVSNNISTYAHDGDLVQMPVERNNGKLPELFTNVINSLGQYNSPERQRTRIKYARKHTYKENIRKMERFINENVLN